MKPGKSFPPILGERGNKFLTHLLPIRNWASVYHVLPTPSIFANERFEYPGEGALSVLRSLPHAQVTNLVENIFAGDTPDHVTSAFRRACQKAGITDSRFHDLRHTSASWLRMSGAEIHRVVGHKDLRMAASYQPLNPTFLADAVRKLDDFFGSYVTRRYRSGIVAPT